MSDPYLGHAVENGLVRFGSVSSLEKADTRSGGCQRKWWYRYVYGLKEPDTEAKALGIALHNDIKEHLTTGNRLLPALVMSGLHMVPDPGPDLLVEQPLHRVADNGRIRSILNADGVPLVGFVDCAHDRGINKGCDDITELHDPPGTLEVIDWKRKSDGTKLEYFMQPGELIKSIQMSGYGFALGTANNREHIRLSHGYFPAKGRKPFKVTKLHVLQDCANSWEYSNGLMRVVKDIAKETNPEKVPGNTFACASYGGCMHREYCSAYRHNSTAGIFGEKDDKPMGLLSTLPPAAQVTPPQPAATLNFEQQLAAEEQKLRAQALATTSGVLPGFQSACSAIQASGRGFPGLGGAAAQMYAAIGGQAIAPGSSYSGVGELARITFSDPGHVLQLAAELATPAPVAPPAPVPTPVQAVAQSMTYTPMIMPPDAPVSNPALAAKPLELAPNVSAPVVNNVVYQPLIPQTVAQSLPDPAVDAPKKRGRKPGSKNHPPAVLSHLPTTMQPGRKTGSIGPTLLRMMHPSSRCTLIASLTVRLNRCTRTWIQSSQHWCRSFAHHRACRMCVAHPKKDHWALVVGKARSMPSCSRNRRLPARIISTRVAMKRPARLPTQCASFASAPMRFTSGVRDE